MDTAELDNRTSVLQGLVAGRTEVFSNMYRQYQPMIRYLVITNSGTIEDANDVFQEGMAIIFEKVRTGKLVLTCSLGTFLYSVCSHIWFKELTKRSRETRLPEDYDPPDHPEKENSLFLNELYQIYESNFQKLKPSYKKVLGMFLDQRPMNYIARTMGYKSCNYAKVKKYLGKEQLMKKIHADPRLPLVMKKYAS